VAAENVELLRRYYDSWNAGDTDQVVAALAGRLRDEEGAASMLASAYAKLRDLPQGVSG
jgi:hypothetical protein